MASLSSSSWVAPKVIPGGGLPRAHDNNKYGEDADAPFAEAFNSLQPAHYGPQDLLACAAPGHGDGGGTAICVYDMNSAQLVQTLLGHERAVTALQWKQPKLSYLQHEVFLFSADRGGHILLWDVTEGIVINRIRVPCEGPVQVLSLLSDQHLLVLTQGANSYVFNAHLLDSTVLPPAPLPLRCREGSRPVVRLAPGKLSASHTAVVLMGDRARIISHLDPAKDARPTARDLIYDSDDGTVTVVDAFFSEAEEDVLYFATPTFVGCYDWRVGMVLNEQVLWSRDGVELLRIFPSSPSTYEECGRSGLPAMYSFTSDQRLTAWYTQRSGKFSAVSTDVRGARIASKSVASVVQSDADSSHFAVLFEDGSLVKWIFNARCRRWRLTHYCACPIQRPTSICRVGPHHCICCAMESGHVVVMDAKHGTPLKRMNLVYSGGTRIILLCPHKRNDAVWVVSNRVVDGRNHHQVSLLDTRSGEVVRVLRKPSMTAEATKAKGATLDATGTYLLLSFWNGTFEVWNTEDGRLLHMHSGLGVADVAWAPGALRQCLMGVQGSPELLAVVFSEGTLSLWSVYRDRCVISRDAVPLLPPTAISGGTVQSVAVGGHLVVFDSTGVGTVVSARESRLALHRLKGIPPTIGCVRCVAASGASQPSPTASFASFDVFSGGSGVMVSEGGALDDDHADASTNRVATVFDDGTVGVWDVSTGDRLGLSTQTAALQRMTTAVAALWLGDGLALLCGRSGTIYVTDRRLSTVNSPVRVRALRRPLQNPSFMPPAQRTYLQTSLELMLPVTADDGRGDSGVDDAAATPQSPVSGAVGDVVRRSATTSTPGTCAVYRGPFGQLLGESTTAPFREEMALYQRTMVPPLVQRHISHAAATGKVTEAAFWVARWFGQREKQRMWALASLVLDSLPPTGSPTAIVRGVVEPFLADGETAEQVGPAAHLLANALSVSCASQALARHNRGALTELRALALRRTQDGPRDDSKARLQVARDFVKLGEPAKAVDVLLECRFESAHCNHLATLAVAVAAGAERLTDVRGGCGAGATPTGASEGGRSAASAAGTTLLTLTTKRAASMLLAAGETDAAVEKYILSGDFSAACRALESQGRWLDAVTLAKLTPMSATATQPLLRRWAQQCARTDVASSSLPASRILVSQGLLREALELLAASAHLTDVAGVLAIALASHYAQLPERERGGCHSEAEADVTVTRLADLVPSVLSDYISVLNTVGNGAGEAAVLKYVGDLKRTVHALSGNGGGEGALDAPAEVPKETPP